jgi:hypothetical protein
MRQPTLPSLALALAIGVALAACGRGEPADAPAPATDAAPADAAPLVQDQPLEEVPPATASPEALGSLRVGSPAEGTISFDGFGPARFGGSQEDVRIAWGGDLGDPQPSEPGGCYYLVPQPLTAGGYRVAFMIEGDRFARIDIRADDVAAPGGGRVGMGIAEIEALYGGRVEQRPHKYVPDARYLRITDPAGGDGVLLFETDAQGRVDAWRVGVAPQVDYVEGCS